MKQSIFTLVGSLMLVIALTMQWTIPVSSYIVVSSLPFADLERKIAAELGATDLDPIYPALSVYRLRNQTRQISIEASLRKLERGSVISSWQSDSRVEYRNVPDDQLYGDQWDMTILGLEDAWESSTGGTTTTGDTIVVAALDFGYDINHVDLAANIWVNHDEVPDDGVDNDENGYIDDYYGYSTATGGDEHPQDIHGTAVLGIMGAVGNNGKGVTGVNWNVKLLPVSGVERESDVIEAYGYIRKLREDYNLTNGAKGAFIVVSNFSGGISGAFAEDHPIWCSLYDDLGNQGVLNIGSVTNRESDVDVEGDMPSTCTSPYLLAVTNLNISDEKVIPSGFGQEHVDLGAPGSQSKTTFINNSYAEFGGTSAAAPHVAGLAALLYSAPCAAIGDLAKQDPSQAALRLRSVITSTVRPLTSLEGRTVYEGRIDAAAAMDRVCSEFESQPSGSVEIISVAPNPSMGKFVLRALTGATEPHDIIVYDAMGRMVLSEQFIPVSNAITHPVELASGIPGVYYLELRSSGSCDITTIVVQ